MKGADVDIQDEVCKINYWCVFKLEDVLTCRLVLHLA